MYSLKWDLHSASIFFQSSHLTKNSSNLVSAESTTVIAANVPCSRMHWFVHNSIFRRNFIQHNWKLPIDIVCCSAFITIIYFKYTVNSIDRIAIQKQTKVQIVPRYNVSFLMFRCLFQFSNLNSTFIFVAQTKVSQI